MNEWSETWTWMDGKWHEGNVPMLGVRSHATWLGSSVFDGARVFEGCMPDIDRHAERVNRSAASLGLKPSMKAGEIVELTQEAATKFVSKDALYIRPMYWAEQGGFMGVVPNGDTTRFSLIAYVTPMPEPTGFTAMTTRIRRPAPDQAPVYAKAGCLYPMSGQAMRDAQAEGFENAIVLDPIGNIAEFATANLWLAKDGVAYTPVANGTFLNGITRQRIITLLRESGTEVVEKTLNIKDLYDSDEVFATGNYSKVMPVTKVDHKQFQPGPIAKKARTLYWEFAHGSAK
ncbi:MAG: branched-chain amino acid aminotransferase [Rhizobiales bacterium]|nr:branched-chain amino acid aminotransferase [Hyphomicrobiales bacterium]